MTLSMHMKRRGMKARPHGFRTSLRVWLAEQTDASREIAETILAHTVGGKVERAGSPHEVRFGSVSRR
jgi:integrase